MRIWVASFSSRPFVICSQNLIRYTIDKIYIERWNWQEILLARNGNINIIIIKITIIRRASSATVPAKHLEENGIRIIMDIVDIIIPYSWGKFLSPQENSYEHNYSLFLGN
jgi:hypothetical protein